MSTTLLSGFRVSVQYREPYVSEALNEKFSAVPRGIVRGAIPSPGPVNDTVLLSPDPMTGETVIVAAGMASTAGGIANVYPVTYRTDAALQLTIPVDDDLHFIYLIGGYEPLTVTAPEIRSYTEAEFEAGTPDTDGGVLLCVVKANSVPGLIQPRNVLYSGMSNTSSVPFRRHIQSGFEAGQYSSNIETVESYINFSYLTAKAAMFYMTSTPLDPSTVVIWQSGETPVSNGYMRFQPAGVDFGIGFRLVAPAFSMRQRASLPRKVRMEMVYRTLSGYSPINTSVLLVAHTNDASNPGTNFGPAIVAPVDDFPATHSPEWSLFVQEFSIPDSIGSDQVAVVTPRIQFAFLAGGMDIASVAFVLTAGDQSPAQMERADGSGDLVPSSYGSLAGFTAIRQDQTPFTSSSGVLLRSGFAGVAEKGWSIRDRSGQSYGFTASPTPDFPDLWIVPEKTSLSNTINFGAQSVIDVFTGHDTPDTRLTNVKFYGNGEGGLADYQVQLVDIPLMVNEIRPRTGFGGIAGRIEVLAADGTVSSPPAYLNSNGTACCTARVRYDSGSSQWVLASTAGNYVNVASVTHVSATQFTVNFTDAIQTGSAVANATFFRAGTNAYFAQISALTITTVTVTVVDAAGGAVAPANNDGVMIVIHGRVA